MCKPLRVDLALLFARHIEMLFTGPDDLRQGFTLHTGQGPILLYVCLRRTLADTAGLKFMYDLTGASGHKPCGLCRNVVDCRGGLSITPGGASVDHACYEPAAFLVRTVQSYRHAS